MTEHKTNMNITKINKYKKLNSNSMTEHKTDINITKIDKYKKLIMTEHKTDTNITKIAVAPLGHCCIPSIVLGSAIS